MSAISKFSVRQLNHKKGKRTKLCESVKAGEWINQTERDVDIQLCKANVDCGLYSIFRP